MIKLKISNKKGSGEGKSQDFKVLQFIGTKAYLEFGVWRKLEMGKPFFFMTAGVKNVPNYLLRAHRPPRLLQKKSITVTGILLKSGVRDVDKCSKCLAVLALRRLHCVILLLPKSCGRRITFCRSQGQIHPPEEVAAGTLVADLGKNVVGMAVELSGFLL